MFRSKWVWIWGWLALAPLGLVGCPLGAPVLNVSPTALTFDNDVSTAALRVSNAGSGVLEWQVEASPAWLTASPDGGTLTAGSQVITLEADLSALSPGTEQGLVTIGSTGGTRSVAVSTTVVAPPTLEVDPTELDFGGSALSRTFDVVNAGAGTLTWNILTPLPTGFSIDPGSLSGSTPSASSQTITVTVDRSQLNPGPNGGPISITSNGGSATVNVSAVVQALSVDPLELDFGPQIDQLSFTITNTGSAALTWAIDGPALPSWVAIAAQDMAGGLEAGANKTIIVSANRDTLGPGALTGQLEIGSDGGSESVALRIEGPDPRLLVTPTELDLGSTEESQALTIQNTGTGTLEWTLEEVAFVQGAWVATEIVWLSVLEGTTGQTPAGGASTLTVQVDRSQVTPDPVNPYVGYLRVFTPDGQEGIVSVTQFALPPTLRTLPSGLGFGVTYVRRRLAIWNGGLGVVNWSIDTAGRPAWATLTPVEPDGFARGSVSGAATDMVTVVVDRTGLTPADQDYTWVFEVTAEDGDGQPLASATIIVSMNIARQAVIAVDTGTQPDGRPNVDEEGVAFLPFGTSLNNSAFDIMNLGTGTLEWQIDTAGVPSWIEFLDPPQGTLEPQEHTTVRVRVDRNGLTFGDQSHTFSILSNDNARSPLPLRVEMQVPKRVIIGVKPGEIAFGPYGISSFLEVANFGDPGSILNFEISSNKSWLFYYPETGSSEGTLDLLKDWKTIDVSIDRAQLEGTGATGTLTVSAFEVNEDGQRVMLETVEPAVVTVSVEAAPLSFEAARARTRIPSLVRWVLLMRDIAFEPISLFWDELDDFVDGFSIFEKDVPIELTETSQFLTSAEHIRTNCVILLDYSGSMLEAAMSVGDASVAEAADPLEALYGQTVSTLIDELPASYNVALMEFHERSQVTRIVTAPDFGPTFTRDKTILQERLANVSILDHGATELLPAVVDASLVLQAEDANAFRIPFDDPDQRLIISVTDGRLTTPPGRTRDVADYLEDVKVRYFPIGWGHNVIHEPLARMSAKSGGHYYPTPSEPTGEIDPTGNPVVRPIVSELLDWCQTEDPGTAPCDQSVAKDLKSQVVFSYVTLTEDAPVTIRVDAAFDNPNDDDEVCLTEQGVISGSFIQKEYDFIEIAGDIQMGQFSLRTDGIQGGQARVIMRAEYIPRNVPGYEFAFSSTETFTVTQVAPVEGGIVADWTLEDLGGGRWSLTPPDDEPLPYGYYGDMLYIDFDSVGSGSFRLDCTVNDPLYDPLDQDQKYFCYPDSILVEDGEFLAPAFPTPQITITSPASDTLWIVYGTSNDSAQIELRNIGGSHTPTGVWLRWFLENPGFLTVSPEPPEGDLVSTYEVDTITLDLDRSMDPGDYEGVFDLLFDNNWLLTEPIIVSVLFTATILPPVMQVTSEDFDPGTTRLDFGDSETILGMTVANTGQSTLVWAIDTADFPQWLNVSPSAGFVGWGDAPDEPEVYVSRVDLDPGTYSHSFTITGGEGDSVVVDVVMVVP